jgi:hypothetical protein
MIKSSFVPLQLELKKTFGKDANILNPNSILFRGGYMLKEYNHANIALIPKVDNPSNPSQMNHFPLISLTNFNYKIISKILSNRFKPLLQKIISPTRSTFF